MQRQLPDPGAPPKDLEQGHRRFLIRLAERTKGSATAADLLALTNRVSFLESDVEDLEGDVTDIGGNQGAVGTGLYYAGNWDPTAQATPTGSPKEGQVWYLTQHGYVALNANGLATQWFRGDFAIFLNAQWRQVSNLQPATGYEFSYGDATPRTIGYFEGAVIAVSIVILTPFDGVGAQLTVGTGGSPSLLMGSGQNFPSEVARFETNPSVDVADELKLFITPGTGASQGAGIVYLEIAP